jgi:hypothetical protein
MDRVLTLLEKSLIWNSEVQTNDEWKAGLKIPVKDTRQQTEVSFVLDADLYLSLQNDRMSLPPRVLISRTFPLKGIF